MMRRSLFVAVYILTFVFVCVHQATNAEGNDIVKVSFNQSVYFINKQDKVVTLTLVFNQTLTSSNITVHIHVYNGASTGESSGDDCESDITVEVPANHTFWMHSFDLSETSPRLPTFSIVNDSDNSDVYIIGDTNNAVVEYYTGLQFKKPDYSFNENDGLANVTLVLDKALAHNITVTITSTPLTAHFEDHHSGPYDVTFLAGRLSVNLTIPLISDNKVEDTKKFRLEIETGIRPLPHGVVLSQFTKCKVDIIDTTIAVNFKPSQYSFEEGTIAEFVITINKKPLIDFAVEVKVTNISTTTGQDYNITSPTIPVHFPADATNAAFSISLIDDHIHENDESFTLKIIPSLASKLPSNITIGVYHTATVIIKDVNKYYTGLQFKKPDYSFNENDGLANVTLVLDRVLAHDITVTITSTPLTVHHADYYLGPYIVTFLANSSSVNLTIPLISDNKVEDTEKFRLEIETGIRPLPNGVVLSQLTKCNVNIIDTTIAVNFKQSQYSFEEGNVAEFVITINKKPLIDFAVEVKVTNISTITGQDHNITSSTISVHFPANATNAAFSISLIDDHIHKNNENFTLKIIPSSASKLPSNITIGVNHTATVIIKDVDAVSVSFEDQPYNINETEGAIQLALVLSIPSSFDITVHLYNANGPSATPGKDYESKNTYSVTFQNSTTKANLNISINDDLLLELDEKFTVTINSTSLPSYVTVGSPDSATVTILSDDCNVLSFNQTTYTGAIDDTLEVELVLDHPLNLESGELVVNVTYVSDEGSPEELPSITFKNQSKSQIISINVTKNGSVVILNKNHAIPHYIKIGDNATIIAMPTLSTNDHETDGDNEKSGGKTNDGDNGKSGGKTNDGDNEKSGGKTNDGDNGKSGGKTNDGDEGKSGGKTNDGDNGKSGGKTNDGDEGKSGGKTNDGDNGKSGGKTNDDDDARGGSSFASSLFYVSIILLLVLAPVAYVSYQNRAKINGLLSGRRGARRGRVKYQLLPSSIGEALRSGHRD